MLVGAGAAGDAVLADAEGELGVALAEAGVLALALLAAGPAGLDLQPAVETSAHDTATNETCPIAAKRMKPPEGEPVARPNHARAIVRI